MKKHADMLQGSLFKGILSYTIPIMLTSILQLLFNAADLVIVGQFCGSISVAAVSATGSITNLIVTLFIGLSVGCGVTVAHGLGGKDDNEVHRIVHTSLPTAMVGGVVLTLVGVIFSEDFLRMMDTPESVLPLSTVYMQIYFAGMIFSMVYNFCAAILRAAGDTKSPLYFLTIAGVVNVVLNVVFVTVLHMNVAGVALATIISQGISAVLCVIALTKRTDACRLYLKQMRFYKKQLMKMIRIGLPAGIQGSLFSISNVLIQASINSFGSEAFVSGNGAAGNIEGFVYVIMNSFHQTALNYIGRNKGAHQFDRIKKIYGVCMGYVILFGFVSGFLVWLFGEPLLSIYITDSHEAIVSGLIRFNFVALPYFLCGMMDVSTGALRGLGSSFVPMLISVLGVCGIRIAWIYTIFQIPQYHTPECLYFSYPLTWTITIVCQIIALNIVYKRKARADRLYTQQTILGADA